MRIISKVAFRQKNSVYIKALLVNICWKIFRFVLLTGIAFLVLFPFFAKISSSFMSMEDLYDQTVQYIPRNPTVENYIYVFNNTEYIQALWNTTLISFCSASIQMFVCTLVGYGLAKFKFKMRGLIMGLVIFTIMIPPQTIMISLFMKFRFFDILGIFQMITGSALKLNDSIMPSLILSLTGLGLKNGLYIFVMRQYFVGLPNELEEAAFIDGASVYRTFFSVAMPLAKSMMITIFLFAFSWLWTDTFYASIFYSRMPILSNIVSIVSNIKIDNIYEGTVVSATMVNTAVIMVILPLLILFLFTQKYLIQGVEKSGITG